MTSGGMSVLRPLPATLFALSAVAGLGCIDFLTSNELPFSLFYLPAVVFAAWYAGFAPGALVSLAGTAIWLFSNHLSGQSFSSVWMLVLNAATRVGFFTASAFIAAKLKMTLDRERVFSRTDNLTGSLNRIAFYDVTTSEIERLRRYHRVFTVVYIDLDNFKAVNDNYGHAEGDSLLKAIADTIKGGLRPTDALARMGGDEFIILLPETGADTAGTVIERIRSRLADKMLERSYSVTLSMGVVTCSAAPPSVDKLILLADEQMYVAKKSGKNDVCSLVYMN